MAKDGTARGGARIGAGKKSKALSEKIIEGKFSEVKSEKNNKNFKIPSPKEYLNAEQKMTGKSYAGKIYRDTYKWLNACGCGELVTSQLVENYAQMVARHIQCEELSTKTGLLAKHPTTGEPIASPFVKMSLDYLKSANQLWYQIYQIVKENSTLDGGLNNRNDLMENILSR